MLGKLRGSGRQTLVSPCLLCILVTICISRYKLVFQPLLCHCHQRKDVADKGLQFSFNCFSETCINIIDPSSYTVEWGRRLPPLDFLPLIRFRAYFHILWCSCICLLFVAALLCVRLQLSNTPTTLYTELSRQCLNSSILASNGQVCVGIPSSFSFLMSSSFSRAFFLKDTKQGCKSASTGLLTWEMKSMSFELHSVFSSPW